MTHLLFKRICDVVSMLDFFKGLKCQTLSPQNFHKTCIGKFSHKFGKTKLRPNSTECYNNNVILFTVLITTWRTIFTLKKEMLISLIWVFIIITTTFYIFRYSKHRQQKLLQEKACKTINTKNILKSFY